MRKKKYILSPCGTSLLTNQTKDRSLIFKYANEKDSSTIPAPDKAKLKTLIRQVDKLIADADCDQASKMSAELNGIVQIYQGQVPTNDDYYLLLSTDTWLGEQTAELVKKWIIQQNTQANIEIYRQDDLQTKDLESFQLALSELVKKFDDELPSYSQAGYQIVFNLTGGFKSVQGFLQSIANFFADETVYIFESSSQLMRIPRLPVKMDALDIVESNISFFRNLSIGLTNKAPSNIPETLLFTADKETCLSAWGEVVWLKSKSELYKKSLIPSPRPEKIKYSTTFIDSTKSIAAERLEMVNNSIDQLNRYFLDKSNPRSLDFKQLKGNPSKISTHEIDAWADGDAKRIFGHFEKDCFVLDKLDKGLH